MLTAAGRATWHAIEDHIAAHGEAPSYGTLGAIFGTTREAAHGRVKTLIRSGVLQRPTRGQPALRVLIASGRWTAEPEANSDG